MNRARVVKKLRSDMARENTARACLTLIGKTFTAIGQGQELLVRQNTHIQLILATCTMQKSYDEAPSTPPENMQWQSGRGQRRRS